MGGSGGARSPRTLNGRTTSPNGVAPRAIRDRTYDTHRSKALAVAHSDQASGSREREWRAAPGRMAGSPTVLPVCGFPRRAALGCEVRAARADGGRRPVGASAHGAWPAPGPLVEQVVTPAVSSIRSSPNSVTSSCSWQLPGQPPSSHSRSPRWWTPPGPGRCGRGAWRRRAPHRWGSPRAATASRCTKGATSWGLRSGPARASKVSKLVSMCSTTTASSSTSGGRWA
jgi:hypothetical protein